LYELSGHASYYSDNMYVTEADEEGNKFYIKPMNCPHHHMIFRKIVNSYRDLPLRLSEHAGLYRYELSGTLTGLIRMRGPITQNDSHIYVTPEQVEVEFVSVLNLFEEVYRELNFKDYWFRLSLPDFSKTKYTGNREQWEFAAKVIRDSLIKTNMPFVEVADEAAFYGPKLDVQINNISGKEDTIATVQLDIVVPERMGITYVDADSNKQFPLVIHKSIMGAFERFMAFLLEQTGGNLPVWLSPEQLRVISVNQEETTIKFIEELEAKAHKLKIRIFVDNTNESVGKKIRAAQLYKVPYAIVVGQKEIESGLLKPRIREDLKTNENELSLSVDDFMGAINKETQERANKSSL
jgi:threonyl-tRNA synthetase